MTPETLLDFMGTRRSIRQFKPEPPARATVDKLIEAAVTAPSAGNAQPWRFIAVTSRDVIESLAAQVRESVTVLAASLDRGQEDFRSYADSFAVFEKAPLLLVVAWRPATFLAHIAGGNLSRDRKEELAGIERHSAVVSASLSIQNLLLMAHALGLGACCMTGPLLAERSAHRTLGLSPSWRPAAFIAAGFPADTPAPPPRRPAAQVLRWIE